jgi:hypothetical protein
MGWPKGVSTKKHTEEFKENLRKRMMGNTICLGRKHSQETKDKIGNAHRGVPCPHGPLSDEHKRKIGDARLGRKRPPFSEEWRRNIGTAHIGVSRGEKSGTWKGGITSLRKLIRDSYKYRDWRASIFQRDDFTCHGCWKRGARLQADHYPLTFEQIIRENHITTLEDALSCTVLWDIRNGRTMCCSCHRKTETWGTRRKEHGKEQS